MEHTAHPIETIPILPHWGNVLHSTSMSKVRELERLVLSLPAEDREQLALSAWESLESEPAFVSSRHIDAEGVELALQRDREIESGQIQPLGYDEFRRRTGGAGE